MKKKQLQFVQSYGFDTVEDFEKHQLEQQHTQELAAYEADEYSKFIDKVEFPDEMRNLLLKYRQAPSKELLEMIEAEFPVDVVKTVAGNVALAKGQLQQQILEAQNNEVINSAKEYLDINVSKYQEEFKNPAFTELYGEAFRAFGVNLDTERFVTLMRNYADYVLKNANIKNGITKENEDITNEIAGLNTTGAVLPNTLNKDISNMSERELNSYIAKYV